MLRSVSHQLIYCFSSSRFHLNKIITTITPQVFYNTVRDTQSYHKFIPWCTKSQVLKILPTHQETQLSVSFGIYNLSYVSKVYETVTISHDSVKCRKIHSISRTNPFKELESIWLIKDVSSNPRATQLEYTIQFQFKNMIYQKAASMAIESLGKGMFDAFFNQSLRRQIAENKSQQKMKVVDTDIKIQKNPGSSNHQEAKELRQTTKIAQLDAFLEKYSKYRQIYQTNSVFRSRVIDIYGILKDNSAFEQRMVFQLDNLLLYMNIA